MIMRRKDREMDKEFAYNVVDKAPFATISMVRADKTAYGVPISIVREGNHFYFHSAMEGEKIESLFKQPQVCISAVSKCKPVSSQFTLEYESAVFFGNAVMVKEKEEKIHGLFLLCKKFANENMHHFQKAVEGSLERTAVIRIDITHITAKRKQYDKNGVEMKWGRME